MELRFLRPELVTRPSFYVFLALSFFAACHRAEVLVKVGDREITKKDVEYRDKVIRFYYPEEKRSLGLKQLTDVYVGAQILHRYGRPVTENVMEEEAARIDKNTKMPSALAELKQLFGKDREAYLRVYVMPIYVNRVLRFELFSSDKRIQGESLQRAKDFANVAKPAAFKQEGEARGGEFIRFEVSREGIDWNTPQPSQPLEAPSEISRQVEAEKKSRSLAEATLWVEKILKTLKPGEIYTEVVDKGEHWLVSRYVRPKKNRFEMEGILFPKENYSAWLEKERAKVPVETF